MRKYIVAILLLAPPLAVAQVSSTLNIGKSIGDFRDQNLGHARVSAAGHLFYNLSKTPFPQ